MKTVDINELIATMQELAAINGSSIVKVDKSVNPNNLADMSWLTTIEKEQFAKQFFDGLQTFSPYYGRRKTPEWRWLLSGFPKTALELTSETDRRFRGKIGDWVIEVGEYGRSMKEHVIFNATNKKVMEFEFRCDNRKTRSVGYDFVATPMNFVRYAPMAEVKQHIDALMMSLKLCK